MYLYLGFAILSLKKDLFASEIICFFMRILHQRHENWLHLLIARVLFVRLSWSKVQDIPETFFVTYHQETIVKSSQLLQNMVLHTQGSATGILSPSMNELPGYKQHRRGFFFEK